MNPGFGGEVTLIGHSLGSVIVWDLLALSQGAGYTSWGPTLPHGAKKEDDIPPLPFVPENTFLLGSPLGLFLTLRGSHFEMSQHPSFKLPTSTLFNIFHPADPVAYRIEPLLAKDLDEVNKGDFPDPQYVPAASGPSFFSNDGVQLHLKAKMASDNAQKAAKAAVSNFASNFFNVKKNVEANANNMFSGFAAALPEPPQVENNENGDEKNKTFALGGDCNPRVDYALQQGILSNEMMSSITAHTSYFTNDDVLGLIVRQVSKRMQTRSNNFSIGGGVASGVGVNDSPRFENPTTGKEGVTEGNTNYDIEIPTAYAVSGLD